MEENQFNELQEEAKENAKEETEKNDEFKTERTYDLQSSKLDMGGLRLVFYGMLFVAINIRIEGFDIIPDVIGYLMAIVGLSRIEQYDENFSLAKKVSYLLAVIALLNIYQAPAQTTTDSMGMMETTTSSVNFNAGLLGSTPAIAVIMMIIGVVSTFAFAYFLCCGMKNLLTQIGDSEMAKTCDDRWKLILISEAGLLGSFLLTIVGFPFGITLTLGFVIFALVAIVLFLVLIHRTCERLDGADPMNSETLEGSNTNGNEN